MSEIELSSEAQQYLMQLQMVQTQLQNIAMQKDSISMQNFEMEKALDELKKINEKDDVFKAVGPILIKSNKADMLKELKEKKELGEIRMKNLNKQEEKLQEKIREGQNKLQEMLMPKAKKNDSEAN